MPRSHGSILFDNEMRDVALVLRGYTVSTRGRCLTRIGANYVMRDDLGRCFRLPVDTTLPASLGLAWADFSRTAACTTAAPNTAKATWEQTAYPSDVALVLQGHTVSTRGRCLARVADKYVMRDGVRLCLRIPVDAVDRTTLGAAWTTFSSAVGWTGATPVVRAEFLIRQDNQAADAGTELTASG